MSTAQLEQLLFEMRVSGFCILQNVVPASQCAAIRQRVMDAVQRQRQHYPGTPNHVGFTPSIINYEQSFAEYLADETLLALIGSLLGEHIRISFTSAIINEPGNERGGWHADWPFNQNNAGHIPPPYPDAVMHITTLWMLSPFASENGGTLLLPGSHRCQTNPTAADCPWDAHQRLAGETNAEAAAGSVLVMDSRLWHATAPNRSDKPRVALAVRYAPWWLNLEILRPASDQRKQMCDEVHMTDNVVPPIRRDVYDTLPDRLKPLYRHWVERSS